MLLVKKCQIFLYLDLVEIRLEMMLNKLCREKRNFFWTIKKTFLQSPKFHFSKEVNQCPWSRNAIFCIFLFSVKIKLDIRLNDALDRKETFFFTIRNILEGLKNGIFPKGLTHAFGKTNAIFFIFCFRPK